MSTKAIYRRIRGRVVRINEPSQKGATVGDAREVAADADTLIMTKKPKQSPHRGYQALSLGLAAGSGAVGALGWFAPSWRRAITASATSYGIGVGASAANAAAWKGKGETGRVRGESINSLVEYGALGATVALHKPTRDIAVAQVQRGISFLAKLKRGF